MNRVAFVTFRGRSDLNRSDATVVPLLVKLGITVEAKIWDDGAVDWTLYDAVILRSCWNYHVHSRKFWKWLEMLDKSKVRVWNKPVIVRWNINKLYLSELECMGIRIVPSVFFVKANLDGIRRAKQWNTLVIKPVVGATAYGIKKFSSKLMFLWVPYLWYLLFRGSVIVQKYEESVKDGEYSLIFFDKKYSHAVQKVPKVGDFRSQEDFGGKDNSIVVSKNIIEQAKHILDFIDEPLLYARVDGLVENGQFILMELELTEPYLFLESDPSAPKRFADVIHTWVNRYTKS